MPHSGDYTRSASQNQMTLIYEQRYRYHLRLAMEWLERSIRPEGGSAAHLAASGLWSRSYPETSGYIINTLLDYQTLTGEPRWGEIARRLGDWLLDIQMESGAFAGGMYPSSEYSPSVFNTGQIIIGLAGLYEIGREEKYLQSLTRAARWLASTEDGSGLWPAGNYRGTFNPTYYTRVTWPMLKAWRLTGDDSIRDSAVRVLERMKRRRRENGAFSDWGFSEGAGAYTHTIAYTLRGFLESGRLLEQRDDYLELVAPAVERLYRRAELRQGRLPGYFETEWKGSNTFVCLTGNAQVALVLLHYESARSDLRLVNAASKLVDFVCHRQIVMPLPSPRFRGAIGGSSPIWGPYMRFRYPNWAAKFFADSIMLLLTRLNTELESYTR